MGYDLYSDFDVNQHKQKYHNYLEVIVDPTGKICYAVPSHTEKLTKLAQDKFQRSKSQVWDMCPKEYWFNTIQWLCNITGCVSMWENCIVSPENITQAQVNSIKRLKMTGLYKGNIPTFNIDIHEGEG